MRRSMPTLGPPPKKRALRHLLSLVVVGVLVALGFTWYLRRGNITLPEPTVADAIAPPQVAPPPTKPPPEDPLKKAGLRRVSIRVDGPLESVLVAELGAELGQPLTQVATRQLIWWMNVPADLRRGDQLDLLFAERGAEEPAVHLIRYVSNKHGKTFAAYRFRHEGAKYARFYEATGGELEERLIDGPIDEYEQITSLLRDGRRHKGVDFKAPVGTPVKAPFAGVITRRNWNFRGNGNCIELTESGGQRRKALFLHLAELPRTTQLGKRVQKGEVLAQSGNTGRSFAPHLHYQLMSASDRVLDPFEVHEVERRALDATFKAAFEAEVRRLDGLATLVVAGN